MSYFVVTAAGLAALAFTYVLLRRLRYPALSKIRGPKSSSFILGNLVELLQLPAGQTDFKWKSLYGDVIRFKTVFGRDQLLVADPKALQRILSSYRYLRPPEVRAFTKMLNGKGIVWADGEDHKRQRKVLLPGFGNPESKAFLGVFKGCAESMCAKWVEIIGNSADQKAILDIPIWLSHGTLDAIGQAAFDVRFGVIQNDEHPLAREYKNLMGDVFGHPSAQQIFTLAASTYFPTWMLEWMIDNGTNPRLERAREMKRVVIELAKELVHEKAETLLSDKGSRDVFSLLVKANMDSEAKNKLTDEELWAQMSTILLAGHETTANTLSWMLLELARCPKAQSKLRNEIQEMEATIRARGDTEFTTSDFDAMPYMTAVIKEGLRHHPVIPHIPRIADVDDILPLAQPITTESGEAISEIFIPKGTRMLVSVIAYNHDKELWGEDAHEFNPDRWLDGMASEKKSISVGVYANLMTFIGGVHACLGWRFAIIEIQAFLVEIIGRFDLTMTKRSEKVRRGPTFLMFPVIEGEVERGCQLELAVSIAVREDDT